ncbi:MAG: hypothetical protein EOM36_05770 [Bacteroidia bacterium]|jgi:TolB-like protein|nr:hypothetical protein [Bacteroidia bacterium]
MITNIQLRRIGILVFLLMVSYGALSAASNQTAAVFPFDDNVISSGEAIALSDIFENRLATTGKFDLVERKSIEQLMKELNFGSSSFIDQDTAVKAGRLLSAHWLFLGSVSKLGNTYSVNVKIVNTETGRIVTGASGEANDILQLKKSVESIADKLSKKLLTDFHWSIDVSGLVVVQASDVHTVGVNLGFSYGLLRNLAIGAVGGAIMRSEDSAFNWNFGGKLIIGDPRRQALTVTIGRFPSVGFIYHKFFVEVSPLMFLGVSDTIGLSAGYSLAY